LNDPPEGFRTYAQRGTQERTERKVRNLARSWMQLGRDARRTSGMALLGTFFLCGMGFAACFAFFAAGRFLAGSAFSVTDRVLPFGEALPLGFARARPGARLAITLAGPLAVYVFATLLCMIGLLLGASVPGEGTTIAGVLPSSPAGAAGLQENDLFVSVAGVPIVHPWDLRPALTARSVGPVDVVVQRQGRELRFAVDVGPDARLGVQLGLKQEVCDLLAHGRLSHPHFPSNGREAPALHHPDECLHPLHTVQLKVVSGTLVVDAVAVVPTPI